MSDRLVEGNRADCERRWKSEDVPATEIQMHSVKLISAPKHSELKNQIPYVPCFRDYGILSMASNSVRAPDSAKDKRGWWLKILV